MSPGTGDAARHGAASSAVRIAVAVLAVLVAGELGARLVEPRLPPAREWPDARHAEKIQQMDALRRTGGVDVVFAGTSQMLYAVDPAALAAEGVRWTSYNAAIPAAPVEVQRHWLETVVLPRLDPEVVVLGLSMIDVTESSERSRFLDAYFGSAAVRDDLLGRVQRWAMRWSSLIRNRDALRSPHTAMRAARDTALGRVRRSAPLLNTLGWGRNNATARYVATPGELRVERGVMRGYRLSPGRTAAIVGLADDLREAGVRLVLIDVPLSEPVLEFLPRRDEAIAGYHRWLDSVAAGGTPVLRPPAHIRATTNFADTLHLNGAGTAAVTGEIARRLGDLEPGRFDDAIAPASATVSR